MLRSRWSSALGAIALALGISVVSPPAAQALSEGGEDAGSTIATARVVSGAETTITGSLSTPTDPADVYQISIPDPARFQASSFGSGLMDVSLSLLDSTGRLIAQNDTWYSGWSTNSWGTLPAGWTGNPFVPPAPGTYYLGVSVGSPTDDSGGTLQGGTPWYDPDTHSPVYGPNNTTDTLGGWSGSGSGSYGIALGGVGTPTARPTLYAVGFPVSAGSGFTAPSSLYTVDPDDGQLTLVGAIELDGVPLTGLSGIDVGLDGTLYAVDNPNQRLLTLGTTSVGGVVEAAVVGPYGSYAGRVTDLAFDAHGYLYGLVPRTPAPADEEVNTLVRVRADGTVVPVREYLDLASDANGLAWSPTGAMVAKAGDELSRISPQTGALDEALDLSRFSNNALEFSPDGVLYTVVRPADWGDVGTGSTLTRVDLTTGFLVPIGNDPDVKVAGLAFDTGTGTPPGPSVELAVGLAVDDDVAVLGQDLVFTLSVQNRSATSATGVEATYLVPSGLTYKSHEGGTYDPGTGSWTIGGLASGSTASLQVTATTVTPGAWNDHVVTVAAAEYVPGPAVAVLEVYVLPVAPGQPAITSTLAGDGRVLVTFSAPTDDGGSPVRSYNLYVCSAATTGCTVDTGGTPISVSESPYLLTAPNGSTYGLALTAVNNAGESAASATAYATPHAPTIVINRAWPSKGKVYVDFTATVAPLEELTGYGPVEYGVTGSKGAWTTCTMDGAYCTVKSSAKTVQMRVRDDGTTWVTSAVAQVSRR